MLSCAEGTHLANHNKLPCGESGSGGLAGGYFGDAVDGVPGGEYTLGKITRI